MSALRAAKRELRQKIKNVLVEMSRETIDSQSANTVT